MPTLRLLRPTRRQKVGQPLHACVNCGDEASETNANTSETNWYGKLYPESMMIKKDGKWRCIPHYHWYYHNRNIDTAKLEINEESTTGTIHGSVDQS